MSSASPDKSMFSYIEKQTQKYKNFFCNHFGLLYVIVLTWDVNSFFRQISRCSSKQSPYHSIFPEIFIKILVYSFVVIISRGIMKNSVKSSLRKSSCFPLKVLADWNDVWRHSESEVNSTRFNNLYSKELTDQNTVTMISYRIVVIGTCLSIYIFIFG